jgi:HSP20 family protein
MRTPKPASGIASLKQEVDRLFERFFEPWWGENVSGVGEWTPSLDLSEAKDALIVKMDIPGMESKDIQVSIQDQVLTVKGERKEEAEEKDERLHRVERSHGAFTRAIRLPVTVDASKVSAAFKNGVLTVTLPKTPLAQGTTIHVKAE